MTVVLRVLADGGWHNLEEIAKKTHTPIKKLVKHCELLSEHEFLEYDTQSSKTRLGRGLTGIMEGLKTSQEEEANWERRGAGTIIVPPGKLCRLQSLSIHNATKKALQFELIFNLKPREITVSEA